MTTNMNLLPYVSVDRYGNISMADSADECSEAIFLKWDGASLRLPDSLNVAGAKVGDSHLYAFQNTLTQVLRIGQTVERIYQVESSIPEGLDARAIPAGPTFPNYHNGYERRNIRRAFKGFTFLNAAVPASSAKTKSIGLFAPGSDYRTQGTPYLVPAVRDGVAGWRILYVHIGGLGVDDADDFAPWHDKGAIDALVARLSEDDPEVVATFTVLGGGQASENMAAAEEESRALAEARPVYSKRSLRVNAREVNEILNSSLRGVSVWRTSGRAIDLMPKRGGSIPDDGRAKNCGYIFNITSYSANVDEFLSPVTKARGALAEAGYVLCFPPEGSTGPYSRRHMTCWVVRDLDLANRYLTKVEGVSSLTTEVQLP